MVVIFISKINNYYYHPASKASRADFGGYPKLREIIRLHPCNRALTVARMQSASNPISVAVISDIFSINF